MAIYVGLCDYDAMIIGDLSFRKGEHLRIIDRENESWWYAKSLTTNQEGYVPADEIAPDESNDTILSSWFVGPITGAEAERRLLRHEFPSGTFLVRNVSQIARYKYVLCVRDREAVKQYGIDELANKGFCIEGGSIFSTLQDLIAHYMEDEDGLPCKLALACPGDTLQTESCTENPGQMQRETTNSKRDVEDGKSQGVQTGIWKQSKKQLQLGLLRVRLCLQQNYQKLLKV